MANESRQVAPLESRHRYFLSYTDIFAALHIGRLHAYELESGTIVVACDPKLVIQNKIQNRATWMNTEKPKIYSRPTVDSDDCDDRVLETWQKFQEILHQALGEGRLTFTRDRPGDTFWNQSYPALIDQLTQEGFLVWHTRWWFRNEAGRLCNRSSMLTPEELNALKGLEPNPAAISDAAKQSYQDYQKFRKDNPGW